MIEIKKTYKNYVGGKYVRSESGKTFTLSLKNDSFEVPLTSKKDIRDAVTASKNGFQNWSQISPYTKTQILYLLMLALFPTHICEHNYTIQNSYS